MDIILENNQKVNQKDLEEKVKEMYKSVALFPEKKYHFEMGRKLAVKLGINFKRAGERLWRA